jgi:hypothetical protein
VTAELGPSARACSEAEVDHEAEQVLLRAVVQVALDATPLGVGRAHHPGAGGAQLLCLAVQLVERGLQRGVQLHVAQREPELAREVREQAVGGRVERRSGRRLGHDQSEQPAGIRDRRDVEPARPTLARDLGQPHARPPRPRDARTGDDGLLSR